MLNNQFINHLYNYRYVRYPGVKTTAGKNHA